MTTKTDPRDTQHGEEEEQPRFGDYSPKISQPEADELQRIYDQSDPEATASGLPDDPRSRSQALSGSEIEEAENLGGNADTGTVSLAEKKAAGEHSIPFSPTDKFLPPQVLLAKKFKKLLKRKRLTVPAAVVAFIVMLGVFYGGIAQGPLQLVHLSETLEIPLFHNDQNTKRTLFKLFNWVRTGEVGTNRLSIQGNLMFPHLKKQMVANGIDLKGTSIRGFLQTARFDTSKAGSLYRGNPAAARARIAADIGVPVDKVKITNNFNNGAHIEVDCSDCTERQKKNLIGIAVRHTKYGEVYDTSSPNATRRGAWLAKTVNSVTNRWFNVVYDEGQPSGWFHPFEKVGRPIDARVGEAVKGSRAVARLKQRVDALPDSHKEFIRKTGDRLNTGAKVTGVTLGVISTICIVKDVASSLPKLNRVKSIIPAMKRTVTLISVGSQVKSGQIPDPEDVGELVEGFKNDEGQTIHNAKALRALQNEEGGEDISPEIKQSFSEDSTPKDVEEALDSVGADTICSDRGQFVQLFVGATLLVVPGASVAGRFIAAGAGAVAVVAITKAVKDMLSKEQFLGVPFEGPNGGNVVAYGAREFANSAARGSGGIALSAAQSAKIDQRWLAHNKAEFNSKSLAGRLFDAYDYRSVAGKAVDKVPANSSQAISSLASSLMSPLSTFVPKVSAAEKVEYDWGFPQFGFSDEDIDNPLIDDPYKNADEVAKIFKAGVPKRFKKDIKTCFGVEITQDSKGLWSVITKDDPIPTSAEYEKAKCGRGSSRTASLDQNQAVLSASTDENQGEVLAASTNNNWLKIRGFIIASKAMNGFACLELDDEQSCEDSGAERSGAGSTASEPTASETPAEKFDVTKLKQPSDKIKCAPNTKDAGVIDGYTGGKKVRIRLCEVTNLPQGSGYGAKNGKATVNSRVSGAVYAMVEAAKKDGVTMTAASTARTMADQQSLCPCDGVNVARPGYSNHQLGVAIDFGGGVLMDRNNPMWKWLNKNADKFGYKPYEIEPWHWSPFGK